jgi:hypothetical protein
MGESDYKRVGLQVSGEKHEKWHTYAEENPEVSSVSHLIRTAVTAYIDGTATAATADSGDGLSQTERRTLEDTFNAVREIRETVDDVDGRLADVQRHVSRESELTEVESEIYSLLPTTDPSSEDWHQLPQRDREEAQYTAEQIARVLDVEERYALDACQSLYENVGHVRITKVGDETAFWREGEE